MLVEINTYIVFMVLDSFRVQNFHYIMVAWVKMPVFRVDMNSSVHIGNKTKDILILGFAPTQELNDTVLTTEAQYSIDFSRWNIKFCLTLHYTRNDSFLFVNATKSINSKQKILKKKYRLCLRNISWDFSASNMKKRIKWMCVRSFCWI